MTILFYTVCIIMISPNICFLVQHTYESTDYNVYQQLTYLFIDYYLLCTD